MADEKKEKTPSLDSIIKQNPATKKSIKLDVDEDEDEDLDIEYPMAAWEQDANGY